MKNYIKIAITVVIVLTLAVLGFVFTPSWELSEVQKETLLILGIICGASILYCFVVGEITKNNSQMDKLWSLLPEIYLWVVVFKSNFDIRILVMAVLATLWGIRLTANFAKKGAYSIKFWSGEEDYRWVLLRENPTFKGHRIRWALFDLFFISLYQNALVLAITLPSVAVMGSNQGFGVMDFVAAGLMAFFLAYETIADAQQMKFQTKKWAMIHEGKKLEELPEPYNLGFNTQGLWSVSRHPNYLGEQGIWLSLYLFAIGAGITQYGVFHWTMFASLLLILLFLGSSTLAESISSGKYPEYANYQKQVFKYLPIRKYRRR